MKILGFDTSWGKTSVAISEGDTIIATSNSSASSAQAEELIMMIEQTLAQGLLSYSDIDYLAVTTGPGSFTGIRVGLAAASGIMLASGIKPVAVTSFEAINFRIRMHARGFDYSAALINAYREQIYLQIFDCDGVDVGEPKLLRIEECEEYLLGLKGKIAIGGSGAYYIKEHEGIVLLPRFQHPEARSLCRIANAKILSGGYSEDISPLYIRLPDAKLPTLSSLKRNVISAKAGIHSGIRCSI